MDLNPRKLVVQPLGVQGLLLDNLHPYGIVKFHGEKRTTRLKEEVVEFTFWNVSVLQRQSIFIKVFNENGTLAGEAVIPGTRVKRMGAQRLVTARLIKGTQARGKLLVNLYYIDNVKEENQESIHVRVVKERNLSTDEPFVIPEMDEVLARL